MTEPATTEPTKRRHGWRLLGLIVLGMVLLTIGGGIWWYYDDGDLDAVREQARQQGRPLSWGEMGLVVSDAERLAAWKKIVSASKKLPPFNTGNPGDPKLSLWRLPSDEFRKHHGEFPQERLDELMSLLDQLGDHPLVFRDSTRYVTRIPEIEEARKVIRFLQERMLLASPHETPRIARHMLAMCRAFPKNTLMENLVGQNLARMSLDSIATRLTDLRASDHGIANDIRTTTRLIASRFLPSLDGEFLMMLDVCQNRNAFQEFGPEWYTPLLVRAGRHGLLQDHLDSLQYLYLRRPLRDELAWARAQDAAFYEAAYGAIRHPSRVLQALLRPQWSWIVGSVPSLLLHGDLLAAELENTPWPVDTFDPTNGRLRPITRDGRVIAAYSVFYDGIDDGGKKSQDRIFPLYAEP